MTTTAFQEQMLLDVLAIFSSSEFARPARFVPDSGPTVETTVILDPERGFETDALGENPADITPIHVMTAHVPAPSYGDTIVLTDTNETYRVLQTARRAFGRLLLLCSRNERLAIG